MMHATSRETLKSCVARWREALRSADTGPLVIAEDVMRIAARWEEYRQEAGDVDFSSYLRACVSKGRSLAWFARRHRAVERIGRDVAKHLHHEVAVWVAHIVPDEFMEKVKWALMQGRRNNANSPLTRAQAVPIVMEVIGQPVKKPKICGRCEKLELLLMEQGIAVDF